MGKTNADRDQRDSECAYYCNYKYTVKAQKEKGGAIPNYEEDAGGFTESCPIQYHGRECGGAKRPSQAIQGGVLYGRKSECQRAAAYAAGGGKEQAG